MASLTGCPAGCYDSLFPDISLDCEIWRPGILLSHRIAIPTPDQCRASVADAGPALSRRSPCTRKVDSAWKKSIWTSSADWDQQTGWPARARQPVCSQSGSRGVQRGPVGLGTQCPGSRAFLQPVNHIHCHPLSATGWKFTDKHIQVVRNYFTIYSCRPTNLFSQFVRIMTQ